MYALIAMLLSLLFLILLLHFKVKLGTSMILSSLVLAVLLGVTPGKFWYGLVSEWNEKPFTQTTVYFIVTLSVLLTMVNVLGILMKETSVSQRLVPAMQGLFRSRRIGLVAMPLMMGMLPTPGGIMLSAPMVRDLGDHIGIKRSRVAAINFLFRHQWETIWPLFPAVPLIQGMLGISAFTLVSHNIAIMLAGTFGGVVFLLLSGIPKKSEHHKHDTSFIKNLGNFIHAFWPIALIAGLYAGFNITPAFGILIAVFIFLLFHKIPLNRWLKIFLSGFKFDSILLIIGALLFKLNLQAGDAVTSVVDFLTTINISVYFLIFFLPFLVAFLTGLTMPTVAITFPLLIPFIGTGSAAKMGLETLAFSGLICGMFITPVHLCMSLSASYFDTPLQKILFHLIGPVIFIALAGILMAFLG